jgi:signal transduction histidine kinase
MSSLIIIIFVPGVVATLKLYDWSRFDIWDVYVFVYSFAIYGIIISTIPGRLAKFAVEKGRKKLVQSKRALIRYMSHEIRSPLNVVCSGLNLLWVDITKLPFFVEKVGLLDTLASVRQASVDVIQTTNDLLQLEKMDSAAFSISEKVVACPELTKIAEACNVVAREKGISFSVNNQFAPDPAEEKTQDDKDIAVDIEAGGAEIEPLRQPDHSTCLYIDEHKIGQVIRNLITNSAKFTPENQSIAVNIRRSNEADLAAESADKDSVIHLSKAFISAANNEMEYSLAGYVTIEIADTGVGIAPENWEKVFEQFAQFDANKLQVCVLYVCMCGMLN